TRDSLRCATTDVSLRVPPASGADGPSSGRTRGGSSRDLEPFVRAAQRVAGSTDAGARRFPGFPESRASRVSGGRSRLRKQLQGGDMRLLMTVFLVLPATLEAQTLFGLDIAGELFTINATTAVATPIANLTPIQATGLAHDGTFLYALDLQNFAPMPGGLYRV